MAYNRQNPGSLTQRPLPAGSDWNPANRGQGMVEYVIVIALVAGVVASALWLTGLSIGDLYEQVRLALLGISEPVEAPEPPEDIMVSVIDANKAGIPDVRVFAFDDHSNYLNRFEPTGSDGIARFDYPEGVYRFLVRYQLKWFWSDTVIRPQQTQAIIRTGQRPFAVTVSGVGETGIPNVRVYAYSDGDEYIGVSQQTGADGVANFYLVDGDFKFRADYLGKAYWSDVVPSSNGSATITVNSCPSDQFLAEYYNNHSLKGEPDLVRCESQINYDWGDDHPADGIHSNNFSVRWTGLFHIPAGTYTFIAETDDGMQVWVDGDLIIDAWQDQLPTEYRSTHMLRGDEHDISVQYYERSHTATARLRWE
jgi:hypothetical protein